MSIEFITEQLLKPLTKHLLNAHEEKNNEIIKISNIFGDPVLLSQSYIEPDCQQHNPSDYDENEGRALIRTPAFSVINTFLNGKYINKDGRNQLFILSDAGMGKTSLLIIIKLMNHYSFWPSSYKCELLKLGKNTVDEINNLSSKKDTVLLLDALDEDPTAWENIKERLINILELTKDFRNVIITCRTQFFPNSELNPFGDPGRVVIGGYICPMLFISLFDKVKIDKYLNNKYQIKWYMIPSKKKEIKKLKEKAHSILEKMGSLRMRPLLLSHVEDFVNSEVTYWNIYYIYKALVDIWLLREQRKIQELYKKYYKNDKIPTQKDLLRACIYLVEYMQRNNTRFVNKEEINIIIKKHAEISYLKKFNVGGRSLLNINSDGQFRFSHYSIQEFLLAKGLLDSIIPNTGKTKIHATDQLIKFIEIVDARKVFIEVMDFSSFNIKNHFNSPTSYPKVLNKLNFSNTDLSNCFFSKAEMKNINLEKSNLSHSNLEESILTKANLKKSILKEANLESANLAGADLSYSDLSGANFQNANLTGANLSYSDLSGANFQNANLTSANLSHTILSKTNFTNARLFSVNFSSSNFIHAILSRKELDNQIRRMLLESKSSLTNIV